jgi:ribokinase
VDAVDTVGAGDAFNGALAAALAEGRTLFDAAVWATAAAGLAVTRPGAQAALPRREAIDRLAAKYRPD